MRYHKLKAGECPGFFVALNRLEVSARPAAVSPLAECNEGASEGVEPAVASEHVFLAAFVWDGGVHRSAL